MNSVNALVSAITNTEKINLWFVQLGFAFLLVLVADCLFFERKSGASVTFFLLILALTSFLITLMRGRHSFSMASLLILPAALLPGLETLNFLTAAIGLSGVTGFVLFINYSQQMPNIDWLKTLTRFFGYLPFKFCVDIFWLTTALRRLKPHATKLAIIKNWFLPVLLTLGFLVLFAFANPLISGWLARIDITLLLALLSFDRIVFWLFFLVVCWPYLRVRLKVYTAGTVTHFIEPRPTIVSPKTPKFSEAQTSWALLLFNILFGVQTYLDMVYLWGGGSLPDGVTYSQYVHQGTYILLITTLFAAMFILFVTSRKMGMESSRHIKLLLLLWTGQNIILVISTMMRMGLYVEAFALTYLRLAAIIWMVLVMMGLALIIVRLLRQYTNSWLIKANLLTLGLILYAVSLANLPYLISNYNVSIAINSPGKRIDFNYLASLGKYALPAIDKVLENPDWGDRMVNLDNYRYSRIPLSELRNRYAEEGKTAQNDWRQWSFRRERLVEYINGNDEIILPFTTNND
ncbi:MAG: DUF4153 domain-containing protein [Rhizobiaceae bacterium]